MVIANELFIQNFIVGPLDTNCYLVAEVETGEALVIDPGGDASAIIESVRDHNFSVNGIVITHGHVDHIAGNTQLRDEFGCPIMIHELDAEALIDPQKNLATLAGLEDPSSPAADRLLKEGDEISLGKTTFKVIHTPGHTVGGICLLSGSVLLSGDTLFAGSVGRWDFPGGSQEVLISSINSKLMILPDETAVYPGHGPATTIGAEHRSNPWL